MESAVQDRTNVQIMTPASELRLLDVVVATLDSEKAEDIVSIDLSDQAAIADAIVVASGRSSRQVVALSEKLVERVKADLGVYARIEGKDQGDWVLIDLGDVIVHIFRPEVREFYQLEKMWLQPETVTASTQS